MKKILLLIKFEALSFRADKGLLLLTALMLAAGLYSIYYGTQEIARQRENLAELEQLETHTIEELKKKYPGEADAGTVAYYFPVFAQNQPQPWAGLALGQRDVNPYYLKLRLLNLQAQLYDTENINPLKVLSGNFDLAFVLVYLFPLFIITLGYNVLSQEKERGTLPLLLSQPIRLSTVVISKLGFQVILVLGMAWLLSILGFIGAGISPDGRIALWLLVVTLYCLFWFGATFLVIALRKNSSFNAVILLGIWLVLTMVLPSLMNIYVTVSQPLPQGIDLTVQQREAMHSGWDKPKEETMQQFYALYPQWADDTPIKGRFSWHWYYAMHEMGDQAVKDLVQAYKSGLQKRQALTYDLSGFSLPVNAQAALNALAGTDLDSHLQFMESIEQYHVSLKEFYYPFLFRQLPFTHADYEKLPTHRFTTKPATDLVLGGITKLLFSTVLVMTGGYLFFQRKN
ncbi:DUF3526 domain-containing protein [Rapidithrix thailandica]|uniref:DUF3526 domain-containing protein n=1 Tax=Rapidithrix thailandica TaxID=413964 RepID=A0AAW9S5U1_9BACT